MYAKVHFSSDISNSLATMVLVARLLFGVYYVLVAFRYKGFDEVGYLNRIFLPFLM